MIYPEHAISEGVCALCGARSMLIATTLNVCLDCIRHRPEAAWALAAEAHRRSRQRMRLPEAPPYAEAGTRCILCAHECQIPEGGRGFCGLRTVRQGKLVHLAGTPQRGWLHWYRDPLPTNCVADWVCSGHHQYGYHNLAVFYASCTLDCLFCQNWHFRLSDPIRDRHDTVRAISAQELASYANPRTHCVCFFGGDPASQMAHGLAVGKILAEQGVAVCWETAGTMHPRLLKRAVALSVESGGCVKFDLKAFDETLHRVLTGGSNQRTLENFRSAVAWSAQRSMPPPVVASTLLVPGYVDAEEVGRIAQFVASLNPEIPYALLAFHPHFEMCDLPTTSVDHARRAMETARAAGLRNIRLGNVGLLSHAYEC